ncbi:MAG: DUF983 domain-containing protein [Bradyrhizobium sp.]|nr:MAG: DUF983 domain-containing protein [Bradyrhizobium sp.]
MNEATVTAARSPSADQPRPVGPALRRGWSGRCPHCGEGRLFYAYLKVVDACSVCGEDLTHQRADDAPAYLTMVIVGHFIVAGVLAQEDWLPNAPPLLSVLVWSALAVAVSLAVLPRIKGALVGYQWAMRMHGFGGPEAEAL